MNDLSNSIDLDSTLIRAEALFRRFQRTVEAVDKKGSFPAPKVRQRPVASPQASTSDATTAQASGSDSRLVTNIKDAASSKVISPELRGLLSRKVDILPRKIVKKKGDGVAAVGGS